MGVNTIFAIGSTSRKASGQAGFLDSSCHAVIAFSPRDIANPLLHFFPVDVGDWGQDWLADYSDTW